MSATTSTGKTLREVTRAEPCEACGKPDWCARSVEDGALRCMRPDVSQTPHGYRVHAEQDREGAVIYMPDNAPSNGWHGKQPAAKPKRGKLHPTPERATAAAAWSVEQKCGEAWAHRATWSYTHNGSEYARVLRFDAPDGSDKTFVPIHRDGDGWRVGDPPKWFPYRVDELPAGGVVFIVEGEKCADALWSVGIPATTSAHGSKSPHKTDWRDLAGHDVVIWPDNDKPGGGYAEAVASILHDMECEQ